MSSRIVFRPWTGVVLTLLVGVVVVVSLGSLVIDGDVESLRRFGPAFLTLGFGAWMLFWRPAVVTDDGAVTVLNPLSTTVVPWERIDDIETRFGLRILLRPSGKVSAWGAPAASRRASAKLLRLSRETASAAGAAVLQREAQEHEGEAATMIRRELTKRARMPAAVTTPAEVVTRPAIPIIAALAVLLLAAVLFPLT